MMLKERISSAPAARSDAASRLLDALLAAASLSPGMPARDDLPAFLFVIDFGAYSTLGRPITDLPWVHRMAHWEDRGYELPDWAQRFRTATVDERSETSPGTAFLSGLELEVIRRAVHAWWSFDEPDRRAVWEWKKVLEASNRDPAPETSSLWDVRHIRAEREASIRRRLSNVSLEQPPRPTHEPEASEAIAAAVLDTILASSL